MTLHFKNLPPTAPFLSILAQHVIDETRHNPLDLAHWQIYLPTLRSCKVFARVLQQKKEALILPKILPLGQVDVALPPAEPLSSARLYTLVSALVSSFFKDVPSYSTPETVLTFIDLLEELERENIPLSRFCDLVPEEYAASQQMTLRFISLLKDHLPLILKEESALLPLTLQKHLLQHQMDMWDASPPLYPVIAAGSTGSVPFIAAFLRKIASLPQGCVILPGFDIALIGPVSPSHPQYALHNLVQGAPVQAFLDKPAAPRDNSLWGCFNLKLLGEIKVDFENVSYIQTPSDQEEAEIIALLMRETLETPGKTALLITPDRRLAHNVSQALLRWSLVPDDSGGIPFKESHLGSLLFLSLGLLKTSFSWGSLISLLKHPWVSGPLERLAFLKYVRHLEMKFLRKTPQPLSLAEAAKNYPSGDFTDFLKSLSSHLDALRHPKGLLVDILDRHEALIRFLVPTLNDADFSFSDMRQALTGIHSDQVAFYPLFLEGFLKTLQTPSPHFLVHPRLQILGTFESRLMTADLIILGSLNEGTWPKPQGQDTWLNDTLRRHLGLPLSEEKIGYAASDFIQSFSGREIVLTRAALQQGAPAVPSRFLSRLLAAASTSGKELRSRPDLEALRRAMSQPSHPVMSAPCPAPTPPLEARPQKLSVTDVGLWVKNPYALYAKKILKLSPLDPLHKLSYQKDFGILIHDILHDWLPVLRAGLSLQEKENQGLYFLSQKFDAFMGGSPGRPYWHEKARLILSWFQTQTEGEKKGCHDFLETKGTLKLGAFTLTAIADRITFTPEGEAAIIDYKTGAIPAAKKIEWGFSPQLNLEAAIFDHGAFEGLSCSKSSLVSLAFWQLHGKGQGGDIVALKGAPQAWAEGALAGLQRLITAYESEAMPYTATAETIDAAYDHLARLREWHHGT